MEGEEHNTGHTHEREHAGTHGHTHGTVDPSLLATRQGIWAVKWSLIVLSATAVMQVVIVLFTGSIALLADTVHNIGDATTAIPLWLAFTLARRRPSRRFTYGYGRVEDVAGVLIVLTILLSAIIAGYESVNRLFHPKPIQHLAALVAGSIIGFAGNELVAVLRIRVGRKIQSAALVADGYHARADGLTSLGVLLGAVGVWLGFPAADPIVGIVITVAILFIVWDTGKGVLTRLVDGVDPEVVDEIRHAVSREPGVREVTNVRVRWSGHRMNAEINLAVSPELSVSEGHEIGVQARHRLLHHLTYLSNVTTHVDPSDHSGEEHHSIAEHAHDDLEAHRHP